jgi:hypothetical protein
MVEIRLMIFRLVLPHSFLVRLRLFSAAERYWRELNGIISGLSLAQSMEWGGCPATIWKPGSIAPLLLSRQLHSEAMDVLYGENAFQFQVCGSKISFLRVVELGHWKRDVGQLDEYILRHFPDKFGYYDDVFVLRSLDPLRDNDDVPVDKKEGFDAVQLLTPGYMDEERYSFFKFSDSLRLPQGGLRRIRFLNLHIQPCEDIGETEKALQGVTQRIGNGSMLQLLLNICSVSSEAYEPVLRGGDKWLDPLRRWNVREAAVVSFLQNWDYGFEFPDRGWARGLSPVSSEEDSDKEEEEYDEWHARVNKAWGDEVARDVMRPWDLSHVLLDGVKMAVTDGEVQRRVLAGMPILV